MFIEDAFRPYWITGLNNIPLNKSITVSEWIKIGKDYQVNSQVAKDEFTLSVYNRETLLMPLSRDCNRFSSATLESILKTDNFSVLPKNVSWILVKQYYSAFYAAHLILRFLGLSLTQLEATTISTVQRIASLYGTLNSINIENGYYLIDYSGNPLDLNCKKIDVKGDGGSHVTLWKLFGDKMKELSMNFLANYDNSEVQAICLKLDELVDNLDYVGSNNHSWLSRIRNDINYKHSHGVWHPYSLNNSQIDKIKSGIKLWKGDILNIELKNHVGQEIIRYSYTCLFIIGLANALCQDMMKRCSNGKSFLLSGYQPIANLA